MKRSVLFTLMLSLVLNTFGQMRAFSIYVENTSDFDIICEGKPEKGEGIFKQYTSLIKKHQYFGFIIESNKGFPPKGVEGTIRFRIDNPGLSSYYAEVYFDDPMIGSSEFKITRSNYPIYIEEIPGKKIAPNLVLQGEIAAIKIYIDTAKNTKPVTPLPGKGSSKPAPNNSTAGQIPDEPIPDIINFEWEVNQHSRRDKDDDDDGPAYNDVTYFFTTDGSYAAVKPKDKSFSLMIYSPKGHTWMIDDDKKTITVMNMPKTVGEGAMMGKKVAEDIKKSPLQKDRDDESFTITKTGKTKQLFGYTTEEYLLKNNKQIATKNAQSTASFWYAKVPFDPVKIYTMGVGRPADLSTLQNNPKMKNNITAIPVLNKNYLWVETEAGGMKGLETISILHRFNTIRTAGYTIKVMKSLFHP